MTAAPLVDDATRRRRAGQLALVLVHRGATRVVPGRRRRRRDVCNAARVLTALGARVEVHPPALAWPRPDTGRLVVANRVCPLDDLVLRTVVPDVVVWSGPPTDHTGLARFVPAPFRDAAEHGAAICPIAVRYRAQEGADPTALLGGGDEPAATIRRALVIRGLVIEVHLLPMLSPGDDEPRSLAALAEHAIAGRLRERAASGYPA